MMPKGVVFSFLSNLPGVGEAGLPADPEAGAPAGGAAGVAGLDGSPGSRLVGEGGLQQQGLQLWEALQHHVL